MAANFEILNIYISSLLLLMALYNWLSWLLFHWEMLLVPSEHSNVTTNWFIISQKWHFPGFRLLFLPTRVVHRQLLSCFGVPRFMFKLYRHITYYVGMRVIIIIIILHSTNRIVCTKKGDRSVLKGNQCKHCVQEISDIGINKWLRGRWNK